jgi:hypothetical protein
MRDSDLREITAIVERSRQNIIGLVNRETNELYSELERFVRARLGQLEGAERVAYRRKKLKFDALGAWFRAATAPTLELTFAEIGDIIGEPLCAYAYGHSDYWQRRGRSRISDCWLANGYRLLKLDFDGELARFVRDAPAPLRGRGSVDEDVDADVDADA